MRWLILEYFVDTRHEYREYETCTQSVVTCSARYLITVCNVDMRPYFS